MKIIEKLKPILWMTLGVFLLVGCDTEDDTEPEVCDEGDLSMVCASGPVQSVSLTDADNYYFSSTLNMTSVVVRGAAQLVDLTFDWSGLTTDFIGHPVNPLTDIDMVLVTLWDLSQAELADAINNDALDQSHMMGVLTTENNDEKTSEILTQFTLLGNPIVEPSDIEIRDGYFNAENPAYDPTKYTHMLMAQTGTEPGQNARMLQLFTLDPASPNTQVNITPNSTTLLHQVDLRGQQRIPVAAGNPAISINWDNITENALGNEFVPTRINRVVVAHYPTNVCELENNFLDLELIHDQWYSVDLTEVTTEYDLSLLADANGTPFPGITADGTWIVALFCGECGNPAPWFMTVLEPC